MVLVTLLPYAVLQRADIAGMRQPSMASGAGGGGRALGRGLRQRRPAGLGAGRLSRLVADLRRGAVHGGQDQGHAGGVRHARTRTRCRSTALWLTNIVVQLIVITTYWSRDAFALMLNLTSAMALIPFLLVAAYGLHDRRARARPTTCGREERKRDLIIAGIASSIRSSCSTPAA